MQKRAPWSRFWQCMDIRRRQEIVIEGEWQLLCLRHCFEFSVRASKEKEELPGLVAVETMSSNMDVAAKSFSLAHFILGKRATAVDVVSRALEKWELQCQRERRRIFWRDKHPERAIRRITRRDLDTLQWLVLYESECDEKQHEQAGAPTLGDMVVRYVKHLVCVSTPASSLYVAVALNRLLFNYGTPDVQITYEFLTRRRVGSDRYRRAKSVLMRSLMQRFGYMAEVTRSRHGEVRFASCDDQEGWAPLIDTCLSNFTPWSTDGLCTYLLSSPDQAAAFRSYSGHCRFLETDQDESEINRCHVLIEPSCSRRLRERLALAPAEMRLALPRFGAGRQSGPDSGDGTGTTSAQLSAEERKSIVLRLRGNAERRRELCARRIHIAFNGSDAARLDLTEGSGLQLGIDETVRMLEVWAEDQAGPLLLGAYPMAGWTRPFTSAVSMTNGSLKLSIAPSVVAGSRHATMGVTFDRRTRPASRGWPIYVQPWTIDRPMFQSCFQFCAPAP